jgi:hypothetical protein
MGKYRFGYTNEIIIRDDGVFIPDDPTDPDWAEYRAWVDGGGVPDPYVPPEPVPPQATEGQTLAFDHENRIRALEGQPPLSLGDFVDKMRA